MAKIESYRPPFERRAQRRATRQQRGYGAGWQRLRRLILRRDGHRCQRCGRAVGSDGHVDHITPKRLGGLDVPGNLQTLCHGCHSVKTGEERGAGRGA